MIRASLNFLKTIFHRLGQHSDRRHFSFDLAPASINTAKSRRIGGGGEGGRRRSSARADVDADRRSSAPGQLQNHRGSDGFRRGGEQDFAPGRLPASQRLYHKRGDENKESFRLPLRRSWKRKQASATFQIPPFPSRVPESIFAKARKHAEGNMAAT